MAFATKGHCFENAAGSQLAFVAHAMEMDQVAYLRLQLGKNPIIFAREYTSTIAAQVASRTPPPAPRSTSDPRTLAKVGRRSLLD